MYLPPLRFALCVPLLAVGARAWADDAVLNRFVGDWDVVVNEEVPVERETRHVERYAWVLDKAFIRGESEGKADGSREISFGGYNEQADGYAFWVFSSHKVMLPIPPGSWDAKAQTLTWKNPAGWDINYFSQCQFPDADTRECTLETSNWFGKVLQRSRWRATRRAP